MNKYTLSWKKKIFWDILKMSRVEKQEYAFDWEIAI